MKTYNPRPADVFGGRIDRHRPGWQAAARTARGELTERQAADRTRSDAQGVKVAAVRPPRPIDASLWQAVVRRVLGGAR